VDPPSSFKFTSNYWATKLTMWPLLNTTVMSSINPPWPAC
jgi:hypothetical protein